MGLLKHYLVFLVALLGIAQGQWGWPAFLGSALCLGQSMLLMHQVAQGQSLQTGFPLESLLRGVGFLFCWFVGSWPCWLTIGFLAGMHHVLAVGALITFVSWWALWPAFLLKSSEKFQLWQAGNWFAAIRTLRQMGGRGLVAWFSSFFFLMALWLVLECFRPYYWGSAPLLALIAMGFAYWWGYQAQVLRWGQSDRQDEEEGIGFTPL